MWLIVDLSDMFKMCLAGTEEYGWSGVHSWRSEDTLPLQGLPFSARHDEQSE